MKINLVLTFLCAPLIMAAISCSSNASNDCQFGDLTATEGTGGDGGSVLADGGERLCCALPLNFNHECHKLVPMVGGTCADEPLQNFAACRGGVGVCFGGVCSPPNWDAQCMQSIGDEPWFVCNDVTDCDDGNPCTSDSCPAPGCEACLHVPVEDLTPCDDGMVCRQGACCDKPAGFSGP